MPWVMFVFALGKYTVCKYARSLRFATGFNEQERVWIQNSVQ